MYHAYLVHTKMHVRYIIITLLDNGLERKKGQVMQDEAKGILKLDFLANFLKLFDTLTKETYDLLQGSQIPASHFLRKFFLN